MDDFMKPAQDLIKPDRPRTMVFAIVSEPAGNFAEIEAVRERHMAYLAELDHRGFLIGAGPTLDSTGDYYQGAGLIVVRAKDIETARSLTQGDPFHRHDIRRFSLKPWLLSEGDLFLSEIEKFAPLS